MCLNADKQERLEKGHVRATGFVDLRFGDSRIQAEQLDIFDVEKPDGSVGRRIEASGNVVFLRGDERLAGQRLTMDLDSGHGTFTDVMGFVQPGVFIEAREIERVDADTFRIKGGKFTSCAQPTPRWSFSATSATLDVDDKIVARNVLFRVKQVPAMYIPIFAYPIQEDQRSSGFLFPHFGDSSTRGFVIGGGFFWAMGRSYDQTFYFDNYSQAGYGLGHEFRYALKQPSRGTFKSYFFRDKEIGGWDYDLHWNAAQMLPAGVRGSVQADFSSDQVFQQKFNNRIDRATNRQRFATLNLQRAVGIANVQLLGESRDTFFGDEGEFDRRRRLPALLVTQSPRKNRATGLVFSWAARAESLSFGNQDLVNTFSRYDVFPRLSRPTSVSFLQLTPEVGVRYTSYSTSDLDEEGGLDLTGPSLRRKYFESSVDMRGPTFSRVFDTPGNFYSDRFKHVIGPEVTWTYRTHIDDFAAIPRFDGQDQVTGTNQVRYGLVQRLYAKRPGAGGKPEPYEFLSWRVGQTYYVQIDASGFDPNYSSAFFGVTGEPSHWSPLQSQLVFRPNPRVSNTFDFEYDTNFRLFRRLGVTTNVSYPRFMLQGTYSRSRRVAVDPENRVLQTHTLRGGSRVVLWPNKVAVDGSADYNFLEKKIIQTTARLRYDVQCCGFQVEMVQSNYLDPPDRQFRFSIELANIGSMGNFMGGPEERR